MPNSTAAFFFMGLSFFFLGSTAIIISLTNKTKYSLLNNFKYFGLYILTFAAAQWQNLFSPLMLTNFNPEIYVTSIGHRLLMTTSAFLVLTYAVTLLISINRKLQFLSKTVIVGFIIYFIYTFVFPPQSLYQNTVTWIQNRECFCRTYILLPGGLIAAGALIYLSIRYKRHPKLRMILTIFSVFLSLHVLLTSLLIYDNKLFLDILIGIPEEIFKYIDILLAFGMWFSLVAFWFLFTKEDKKQSQFLYDANLRESERDRVAHDLHDGTIQSLYALLLRLGIIAREIENKSPEEVKKEILNVREYLGTAITDLRAYIYINNLESNKYKSTSECLGNIVKEIQLSTTLDITYKFVNIKSVILSQNTSLNMHFIIKEAISNIIKHAHATKAEVILSINEENVFLSIRDNGIGFREKKDKCKGDGIGLQSILERVAWLNGELKIVDNKGTTLEINIPIRGGVNS